MSKFDVDYIHTRVGTMLYLPYSPSLPCLLYYKILKFTSYEKMDKLEYREARELPQSFSIVETQLFVERTDII